VRLATLGGGSFDARPSSSSGRGATYAETYTHSHASLRDQRGHCSRHAVGALRQRTPTDARRQIDSGSCPGFRRTRYSRCRLRRRWGAGRMRQVSIEGVSSKVARIEADVTRRWPLRSEGASLEPGPRMSMPPSVRALPTCRNANSTVSVRL
jgi:hypothetical protein